jgi:hypothetical protein
MKMKPLKAIITVLMATALGSSCNSSSTTTKEEVEIKTIDSSSKAVKENRKKLDDQTKKVEASIEKLDKEFDTTSNH